MIYESNMLMHFGIKGQKWGVRRFQNEDGSLTPEGRERYLKSAETQIDILNNAIDRQNQDIIRLNKKYENADLEDDRTNLNYTREVREAWLKNYYDVLAEDIETDPLTLKGREWIDEMPYGHKLFTDALDDEISALEKKVNDQDSDKKNKPSAKSATNVTSAKIKKESYNNKYANTKMTEEQAIKTAYRDLEKMYPNFDDLPLEKQDQLFIDYMNESGLYRWY